TGSGEDDGPDGIVLADVLEPLAQRHHHIERHGVHPFRTVEGHEGDLRTRPVYENEFHSPTVRNTGAAWAPFSHAAPRANSTVAGTLGGCVTTSPPDPPPPTAGSDRGSGWCSPAARRPGSGHACGRGGSRTCRSTWCRWNRRRAWPPCAPARRTPRWCGCLSIVRDCTRSRCTPRRRSW